MSMDVVVSGELESVPVLSVDNDDIYMGNIKQGDVVVRTIDVTNSGNQDLVITNIKSSCQCITTEIKNTLISPGKTEAVRVRLIRMEKVVNRKSQYLISSNADPSTKKVTVTAYIDE